MKKWYREEWLFHVTVVRVGERGDAGECRLGFEPGDTFECTYECPAGFCPRPSSSCSRSWKRCEAAGTCETSEGLGRRRWRSPARTGWWG